MIDGVSLDKLRTFVASVDDGSLTAAARRVRRTQSVISASASKLEGHPDFSRMRTPTLVIAGDDDVSPFAVRGWDGDGKPMI